MSREIAHFRIALVGDYDPAVTAHQAIPLALARAGARSRWGVALAVAYVLTSNCFWVTKRLASTRLNVFESYLFFGALVLLIVLMEAPLGRESRRMGPGEVTA